MSKRNPTEPGSFSKGLEEPHFLGRSAKGRRLAAEAESARKRRINWLKREQPKNSNAQALARKLEKCRPKQRCLSGACPACALAAQELFISLVRGFDAKVRAS